jgi:hypothetical protein
MQFYAQKFAACEPLLTPGHLVVIAPLRTERLPACATADIYWVKRTFAHRIALLQSKTKQDKKKKKCIVLQLL